MIDNNRYLVNISDNYGYIDQNGLVVIEPIFKTAGEFQNGLAKININGKTGYILVFR